MSSFALQFIVVALYLCTILTESLPGAWRLGQASRHDYGAGDSTACGYTDAGAYMTAASPYYSGVAAVSTDLFDAGTGCGGCYEIRCHNPWITDGVDCKCKNVNSVKLQAIDLSGTTSPPHFDISPDLWYSFTDTCGRVNVTFRQIECAFTRNIQIITNDNHAWWFGMNFYFIAGYAKLCNVELKSTGSDAWMDCANQGSKWFCDDASLEPTQVPITVRLTDCDGNIIIGNDVITAYGVQTFDFGKNFPLNGPTSPVTPQPATQPTPQPVTQPTPQPVTQPSPTPQPAAQPTPLPTSGGSGGDGNILIRNGGANGAWWYTATIDNIGSGYAVSKFEVQNSGGTIWYECAPNAEMVYECPSQSVAYVLPLSVRLTDQNGDTITAADLITAFTASRQYNFGDKFGNGGSTPITPATPAPVTPAPVTPAPVTPAPVTQPTIAPVRTPPPAKPTAQPAVQPTLAPVRTPPPARPTPQPTGGSSCDECIIVNNRQSVSEWWYAIELSNVASGVVSMVEMRDANHDDYEDGNKDWNDKNWSWNTRAKYGPPFSFRITDVDGNVIETENLITDFDSDSAGKMNAAFPASAGNEIDELNEDEGVSLRWTEWFAIIVISLVVVGLVIGITMFVRKRNKKKGTYHFKEEDELNDEVGGGTGGDNKNQTVDDDLINTNDNQTEIVSYTNN